MRVPKWLLMQHGKNFIQRLFATIGGEHGLPGALRSGRVRVIGDQRQRENLHTVREMLRRRYDTVLIERFGDPGPADWADRASDWDSEGAKYSATLALLLGAEDGPDSTNWATLVAAWQTRTFAWAMREADWRERAVLWRAHAGRAAADLLQAEELGG